MHFEETLRANAERLHNLSRRLTDTPQDAEDLLQDTYLLAWRSWQTNGPPRTATAWLVTICLNQARTRWRRAGSVSMTPEDVSTALDHDLAGRLGGRLTSTRDVEDVVMASLDVQLVHRTLGLLPYAQREAVVLMDLVGLTAAEAATLLHVPRGTVLSRAHRGRRALAMLLLDPAEVT